MPVLEAFALSCVSFYIAFHQLFIVHNNMLTLECYKVISPDGPLSTYLFLYTHSLHGSIVSSVGAKCSFCLFLFKLIEATQNVS